MTGQKFLEFTGCGDAKGTHEPVLSSNAWPTWGHDDEIADEAETELIGNDDRQWHLVDDEGCVYIGW